MRLMLPALQRVPSEFWRANVLEHGSHEGFWNAPNHVLLQKSLSMSGLSDLIKFTRPNFSSFKQPHKSHNLPMKLWSTWSCGRQVVKQVIAPVGPAPVSALLWAHSGAYSQLQVSGISHQPSCGLSLRVFMSFVYKLPSPTRSQTQAMVQSQNQGFCHEQLDSFRWDRILTSTTINSGYSQRNRSTNKSTCGKAVLRSGNLHLVITIISSQIPMRREKAWTWRNTSTIRRERRLLGGATLLLKITQKPHMRRYTYMIWSGCNGSIVSCL